MFRPAFALGALLCLALPTQAQTFRLTDLAPPAGFSATYSQATDLNDRGDAAGHLNSASFPVAATWLAPTVDGAQRVGVHSVMPGSRNGISAINAGGTLLGGYPGIYGPVAMINTGSGWQQLPWPDARYVCCGQADDINDAGVAVGSWYPTGLSGAVRWTPNGSGGYVADSLGGGQGNALAINESGQIAGNTVNAGAVLWRPDTTLVDISPVDAVRNHSEAAELNDHGTVVGWGYNADGRRQGFVWSAGAMTLLPGLAGWQQAPATAPWISNARDINNAGWVVGHALTAAGETHGFLWTGAAMLDLNALVSPDDPFFDLPEVDANADFRIIDATVVNNSGQILAVATYRRIAANGAVQQAQHSFLLSPAAAVPEPASAALMLAGAAGLLGWRRRGSRQTPRQADRLET